MRFERMSNLNSNSVKPPTNADMLPRRPRTQLNGQYFVINGSCKDSTRRGCYRQGEPNIQIRPAYKPHPRLVTVKLTMKIDGTSSD